MATIARVDAGEQDRPERAPDDHVTAGELVAVLARRWLSVAAWVGLLLGAAVIYLVLATPIYRASTSLLLDSRGGAALTTPDLVAGRLSQDVNVIESQVRLVSSPAVLTRVVRGQHLAQDPEFNKPKGGGLGLRGLLGLQPAAEPIPVEQQVLANLAEHLDVKRSERTLIIDVEVSSRDPAKAARLADAVAAAFVEDQLAAKAKAAGTESSRLDQRLRELQAGIKAGEAKVEAFKAQHHILDVANSPATPGPAGTMEEQQLNELNSAAVKARAQAADARARLAQVQRVSQSGQLDSLPESLRSGVITTLRAQQAEAQKRLDNLGTQLGPLHPELAEARQQLRGVDALIAAELKRIASALQSELAVAQANEAAAVRALEARKKDLGASNAARVELRNLERTVQADKATYDRLVAADSTLQQEGAATPIARQLAPALLPLRPAAPNSRAILLIALAAGLALGLATALVREHRARVGARRPSPIARRRPYRGTPEPVEAQPAPHRRRFHALAPQAEPGE